MKNMNWRKKAIHSSLVVGMSLSLVAGTALPHSQAQSIDAIEQEIKQYEATLGRLRDQQRSLKTEIAQFETEIKKTEAEIERTQKELSDLEDAIELAKTRIKDAENNISIQKETLSDYLQLIDQADDVSYLEAVFSSESLSGLVDSLKYSETLQDETRSTLGKFQKSKKIAESEKSSLEEVQTETEVLLGLLSKQEADLDFQKQNLQTLLVETAGEEDKYQELLADAESEKKDILATLISTTARTGALSIDEAQTYAKAASAATGVRSEIIMAIIEQETYFGSNVGTGVYSVDMRPSLRPKFLEVCANLGLDPNSTPVSKKPQTYQGWGGAMGYAQIMPPEWLSIRGEVARLTGNPNPSPWNAQDAFMASALILKNKGAANPATEFEGVARYFAGGYWQKYSWYATSVIRKAEKYK